MDKQTGIAAMIAVVTGLVSAGAFKFYEFILRQKREVAAEEKDEKARYRDDLIKRVDKLELERDEHLEQIMELKAAMAATGVEIEYLKRENEIFKLKIDALR